MWGLPACQAGLVKLASAPAVWPNASRKTTDSKPVQPRMAGLMPGLGRSTRLPEFGEPDATVLNPAPKSLAGSSAVCSTLPETCRAGAETCRAGLAPGAVADGREEAGPPPNSATAPAAHSDSAASDTTPVMVTMDLIGNS